MDILNPISVQTDVSDELLKDVSSFERKSKLKLPLIIVLTCLIISIMYFEVILQLFCNAVILVQKSSLQEANVSINPNSTVNYSLSFLAPYSSPVNVTLNEGTLFVYFRGKVVTSLSYDRIHFKSGKEFRSNIKGSTSAFDIKIIDILEIIADSLENHQHEYLHLSIAATMNTNEFLFYNRTMTIPFSRNIPLTNETFKQVKKLLLHDFVSDKTAPLIVTPYKNQTDDSFAVEIQTLEKFGFNLKDINWSLNVEFSKWIYVFGSELFAFRVCPFRLGSHLKNSETPITLLQTTLPFKPGNDDEFLVFYQEYYPSLCQLFKSLRLSLLSKMQLKVVEPLTSKIVIQDDTTEIPFNCIFRLSLPVRFILSMNSMVVTVGLYEDEQLITQLDLSCSATNVGSQNGTDIFEIPLNSRLKFVNTNKGWERALNKDLFICIKLNNNQELFKKSISGMSFNFAKDINKLSNEFANGFSIQIPEIWLTLESNKSNFITMNLAPFMIVSQDGKFVTDLKISKLDVFHNDSQPLMRINNSTIDSPQEASLKLNNTLISNGKGNVSLFLKNNFDRFDFSPFVYPKIKKHLPSAIKKIGNVLKSSQMKSLIARIAEEMFSQDPSLDALTSHDEGLLRSFISELFVIYPEDEFVEKRKRVIELFFHNIFPILINTDRLHRFATNSKIVQEILDVLEMTVDSLIEKIKEFRIAKLSLFLSSHTISDELCQHVFSCPLISTCLSDVLSHLSSRIISQKWDEWKEVDKMLQDFVQFIDTLKITDHVNPASLFHGSDGLKLDQIPVVFVNALSNLVQTHFERCSRLTKASIVSAILRLPPNSSIFEIIGCVIAESSAVSIQKLFQLLGDNMNDENLKENLQQVKSNLPRMPNKLLGTVFTKSELFMDNSMNALQKIQLPSFVPFKKKEYFTHPTTGLSLLKKSAGSATISQGHYGFLPDLNGRDFPVFVKIMKESSYASFKEEKNVIDSVSKEFPAVKETFEEIKRNYEDEFNLNLEIKNMQEAKVHYETPDIRIPHFIQAYQYPYKAFGDAQKTCHMIVMEFIDGISLDKIEANHFYDYYLKRKRSLVDPSFDSQLSLVKTVEELQQMNGVVLAYFLRFHQLMIMLYKQFMEVGLFTNGFIHGDLHGGNIFFKLNYSNPQKSVIVPIDYGNCHKLSKELMEGIMKIGLAVTTGNAHDVAVGLGYEGPYRKDERLWVKMMGDMHFYMQFHKYDCMKKKDFFIAKLSKFHSASFLYKIEYRIFKDLELFKQFTNLKKLVGSQVSILKSFSQSSSNYWPSILPSIQKDIDAIQVEIANCSKLTLSDSESVTLEAAKYIFLAIEKFISDPLISNSVILDFIVPLIDLLSECKKAEEYTVSALESILRRNDYTNEIFDLFLEKHDALHHLLHNCSLLDQDTGKESSNPIEKYKFLLKIDFEAIDKHPLSLQIRERISEYLLKNEIRYLQYIRDHLRIVRNTWDRETAVVEKLRENIFDPRYKLIIKSFMERAKDFRNCNLPAQEIVSLVTSIPAWGTKNLGHGSEIMKFFRSEASLRNGIDILVNELYKLNYTGKLKTADSVPEDLVKKHSLLSTIYILGTTSRHYSYKFESDFEPKLEEQKHN